MSSASNRRRALRHRGQALTVAALVVLADQLSKAWALQHLPLGSVRPLLPGLLALQRVENPGAAFSLFSNSTVPLALVSAVVSLVVLGWLLLRPPVSPWLRLGLALVLGGAVGNGLDRWRHQAVVDFLALVPIQFPIFNLADVAINLAVGCLLIDQLQGWRQSSGDGSAPTGFHD